jgi:hypothetical protein
MLKSIVLVSVAALALVACGEKPADAPVAPEAAPVVEAAPADAVVASGAAPVEAITPPAQDK